MIIGLVATDQIIKIIIVNNLLNLTINIIPGVLNFTYIENTGGAYGIGNDSTLMFIIVSVVIITLIGKFILSKQNDIPIYILFSLGLVISGGLGNLVDRIFRGFVVDYIDFNPIIKYPIFNLADICVVLGCIIIMISIISSTVKNRRNK